MCFYAGINTFRKIHRKTQRQVSHRKRVLQKHNVVGWIWQSLNSIVGENRFSVYSNYADSCIRARQGKKKMLMIMLLVIGKSNKKTKTIASQRAKRRYASYMCTCEKRKLHRYRSSLSSVGFNIGEKRFVILLSLLGRYFLPSFLMSDRFLCLFSPSRTDAMIGSRGRLLAPDHFQFSGLLVPDNPWWWLYAIETQSVCIWAGANEWNPRPRYGSSVKLTVKYLIQRVVKVVH